MEETDYLTIKGIFEMVELALEDAPCNSGEKTTEMRTSASASCSDLEDALVSEGRSRDKGTLDDDAVIGLQTPLTGAANEGAVDFQELLRPAGPPELEAAHSTTPENHSQSPSHHTGMHMFSAPVPHDSSPDVASALLELAGTGLHHSLAPNDRGNESVTPSSERK